MSRKSPIAWCSNCRQAPAEKKDLCVACYTYQYSHGALPDPDTVDRPTSSCRDCGDLVSGNATYCRRCYEYRRNNDHARPKHLWDPTATCRTCRRPLVSDPNACSGYCGNCYKYQYNWRRDRPKHFWGVNGLGWCDCGQPAVARVEVPRLELRADARSGRLRLAGNAEQTITFNLCADCLAMEEEMAA